MTAVHDYQGENSAACKMELPSCRQAQYLYAYIGSARENIFPGLPNCRSRMLEAGGEHHEGHNMKEK